MTCSICFGFYEDDLGEDCIILKMETGDHGFENYFNKDKLEGHII